MVDSVIYRRDQSSRLPPSPRCHALLRRHASSPQPPSLPCSPQASCILTPIPWFKGRYTSSCDEEIYIQGCFRLHTREPRHNLRWGDNTGFFRCHGREMQSKFPDNKKISTKNTPELRYCTRTSNELITPWFKE